jgi:Glutamate 5-kinase
MTALTRGARHTIFLPTSDKQAARRAWIQGSLARKGYVVVDEGAVRALADGRSLLAVGIISAEGHFLRGDSIEVRTKDGRLLAVGLAGYDVQDVQRIIGKHSHEIAVILGPGQRGAVIHRDHLVLKNRGADG